MKAPICDRCNVPVTLEEHHDEFMGRTLFTARCHGEVERVEVYDDELAVIRGLDLVGVAFKQPRLLVLGDPARDPCTFARTQGNT